MMLRKLRKVYVAASDIFHHHLRCSKATVQPSLNQVPQFITVGKNGTSFRFNNKKLLNLAEFYAISACLLLSDESIHSNRKPRPEFLTTHMNISGQLKLRRPVLLGSLMYNFQHIHLNRN